MKKKIALVSLLAVFLFYLVFLVNAQEGEVFPEGKDIFKQVQIFSDSITLIISDYIEPVKPQDLIYGALKGMMKTLDGYSQFLDPESFKEITEETKGEFGGIGIEIGMRKGVLTVITPMEDTPAFEAGIKSGDKVVKIGDKVTRDLSLDDAVKLLKGDAGTEITLGIVREGVDDVLSFTIKRAIIKLKSIKEAKIIDSGIGYVRITEFQERTARDLKDAVKGLLKENANSIIIDVRNNPGGLLESSVEVSELFLNQGSMIVYTEGKDPAKRMDFTAKRTPIFPDIKLALIINKGSASAAEIFAGAIKDNKRGIIVGTNSFGKGSVQTVIPLRDKSALRLTTASYYTPSGSNISDKGIEPDIVVENKKIEKSESETKEKEEEKTKVFEKVSKEKKKEVEVKEEEKGEKKKEYDAQLEAAINILKGYKILENYKNVETPEPEITEEEKAAPLEENKTE